MERSREGLPRTDVDELRPLLAIVGLVVVAAGLVWWIARLRGWRSRWGERACGETAQPTEPQSGRR